MDNNNEDVEFKIQGLFQGPIIKTIIKQIHFIHITRIEWK